MRPRLLAVAVAVVAMTMGMAVAQTSKANSGKKEHPKITMKQARQTALATEKGTIKSAELEREKGRLIYSFDIKTADGIHEVNVDAMDGKVVEDSKESAAEEAKEAKQEKKDHAHKQMPK
ncbi:MAG: PepSY domain-containing protein [Terriglobales bacterium]